MQDIIQQFAFSASITGPICLMLLLGALLRYLKVINENFIEVASKLVFQVTLPALLFLSIIRSESISDSVIDLVVFGVIANIIFFIFAAYTLRFFIKTQSDYGVVLQGAYRANTGIIALAYVTNAYGHEGVAIVAIYVAGLTVLYNILAVIALTPKNASTPKNSSTPKKQASYIAAYRSMVKSITKNPLIISIMLGLIVAWLSIPIPEMVIDAGDYFAKMTLPLALLCTGGTLNLKEIKHNQLANGIATFYRLCLAPLFITLAAYWYGFTGMELGMIFFMSASPVAAASYVMARSMGGNATLAANIIALTTVLSIFTFTLGIMILSHWQLM